MAKRWVGDGNGKEREGMGRNRQRNDMCSGWPDSLAGLGGGIREKERGERLAMCSGWPDSLADLRFGEK